MAFTLYDFGGFNQFDADTQIPDTKDPFYDLNTSGGPFDDNYMSWGSATSSPYGTYIPRSRTLATPIPKGGIIFGTWVRYNVGGNKFAPFGLFNGANGGGGLYISDTGTMYYFNGTGVTALGESWVATQDALWKFMEIYYYMSNTVGEINIFLDGTEVFSASGLDTLGTDTTDYALLNFGPGCYVDTGAWYIGTATAKTDRLGTIKVGILTPDGDTADEDWTLSAGSDSYALVDDFPPDDDTTYLESDTNSDMTGLTLSALEAGATVVHAVRPIGFMMSTDASDHTVRLNTKSGSTVDNDANGRIPSPSDYEYYEGDILVQDPDTSSAWTLSGVNAAEIQVEVTS